MKRVLVVFHDNNLNSGATKSFLSNVEFLQESKKYCVYAVLPKKEGNVAEYLTNKGIEVFQINYGGAVYEENSSKLKRIKGWMRCCIKMIFSYISFLIAMKKIIKLGINCVYSNTSTINIGAWFAKKLNVKHIWHFREFGLEDQNSLHIFEKNFVKLAKNAEHIIMISKVLQDYYVDKYGFTNSCVIHNDISEEYIIKEKNQSRDDINILITGTLCENKGQMLAIRAIEKISNQRLHLYIAGKDNMYGEMLKKYVSDNNIKNIHFCGLVEDMNSLRRKMDISLVCATKEAFGRTIIEDMLANILVIGCNTGAVPELIEDKKTGILYSCSDVDDLVLKIQYIIKNEEKRVIIKESAFRYALKFTKNLAAQEIEKLIRGIL